MLERLGQLPEKLEELYQIILKGIMARRESDRVIVRRTLFWLLYGQSPALSADGLLEAVATHTSGCGRKIHKDALLGLCRNLVEWDESSDTFRFPHLSVREFLVEQDDFKAFQGHCILAETCWTALNTRLTEDFSKDLSHKRSWRVTLVHYAVKNFPGHCQLASNPGESNQSIKPLIDSFLSAGDNPVFSRWIKALVVLKERGSLNQVLHPYSNDHTPLRDAISSPPNPSFAISIWGFAETLGDLLQLDKDSVIQANMEGKSLLCVACEYNRREITKEIIAGMKTIGCSIQTLSPHGHTALHSASQYGSDDTIQLLLDEGVDVNVYTSERFLNSEAPVINNISNNSSTSYTILDRVTPLHLASRNEHLQAVKRLLEKSALVNAISIVDLSSFNFGCLSTNNGSVHLRYEGGLSALHWAAKEGNEDIIRLLLLAGASVEILPKLDLPVLKIETISTNNGSIHVDVRGGMDPVLWALQNSRSDGLTAAELICKYKKVSEIGARTKNDWITLEIGTIVTNNGSVHITSNAKVAIRTVMVNNGSIHLSLLEPIIDALLVNNGSVHIECEGGTILNLSNDNGSTNIQYRQVTTLKDKSDRVKFHALQQYIEKLELSRQSLIPYIQLGQTKFSLVKQPQPSFQLIDG